MSLRFGTDGVRGLANVELTPELVLALGRAAARRLGTSFVIGRDTRRSGPLLQAALSAGMMAEGAAVTDVGVLPTPGVAALSAAYGCAGAVISASHNPFEDNGIKLLAAGGRKLTDETEELLEADLATLIGLAHGGNGAGAAAAPAADRAAGTAGGRVVPRGSDVGVAGADGDGPAWYRRQLVASLEGRRLDGLRVVLDCGHGASTTTAVAVFTDAGADVVAVLGDAPDGTNINRGCGSTDPGPLRAAVVEHRADAGLAFDGDADRVIAVDAAGSVVDGDQVIALCALDLHGRGRLAGDTVVVTVMSNLGFRLAMDAHGITVRVTPVGDRYVLEALDGGGWSLGGEQSGHVIFRELATTGDGVLTGLQLLDVMARTGRPLADLAGAAMTRLPQVLRNVAVTDRDRLPDAQEVWAEVAAVEAELGGRGRVLLRPSGTEALVRVMVEAPTAESAQSAADRLAGVVAGALGG